LIGNANHEKANPTPLAGGAEFDLQDWLSWIDNSIRRETAARKLAAVTLDCDPCDRLDLLEMLHEAFRAGSPLPAFGSIMAEASDWADWASPAERKAYALACFNRMPARDQSAFLEYVQGRRAA
jgi:hypothetical protein